MRVILICLCFTLLYACGSETAPTQESTELTTHSTLEDNTSVSPTARPSITLVDLLNAQSDDFKARYPFRHPRQTLEFIGIEPGMTVVEALPGGGWYSKLLLKFLGTQGHLIGVNYATEMWPRFTFVDDKFMANIKSWSTDWPEGAQAWRDENSAPVSAFVYGDMPQNAQGTADAVLLIRALHNLARFEDGNYLTQAIQDSFNILKPGGIVGVVQHQAAETAPDQWADGSSGYLKQSFVVSRMEAAGFQFVGASDINKNPKDQPSTDDIVWRLPPSLSTSKEDPALFAEMLAIGESNRMTLKFIKPTS
ncbi:MAG: class I SAM-dependent methyltransferase [Gammaproteobacteria bacterium]|nr:class I SAM-dependent methyltransferase [Gammaproteobacteria bacterium]